MNVILLHISQQHVSATHVAIFSVMTYNFITHARNSISPYLLQDTRIQFLVFHCAVNSIAHEPGTYFYQLPFHQF